MDEIPFLYFTQCETNMTIHPSSGYFSLLFKSWFGVDVRIDRVMTALVRRELPPQVFTKLAHSLFRTWQLNIRQNLRPKKGVDGSNTHLRKIRIFRDKGTQLAGGILASVYKSLTVILCNVAAQEENNLARVPNDSIVTCPSTRGNLMTS